MNAKKVMLVAMCVLLVTVIVMTVVLIGRVSQLFGSMGGGNSLSGSETTGTSDLVTPVETTPQSTTGTSPETTITQPATPPATEETEPGHVHEYVLEETVAATCENLGYDIMICTGCGRQDIQNFVDAYGHNLGPSRTVDPTCTQIGYTRATCYRCGEAVDTNIKSALGHDYQLVESVTVSCEVAGYDKSQCTRCGDVLVENEVPAPGHTEEVLGDVITPTCTTDGYILLHCTVCDSLREQIMAASGHDYDDWILGDGCVTRLCLVCQEEEVILLSQLTITNVQSTTLEGALQLQIIVGVDTAPEIFRFTVFDYLNNGTLSYALSADWGLVLTYLDSSGTPVEIVSSFGDPSAIVIPAG